jgi:hypothetical protein
MNVSSLAQQILVYTSGDTMVTDGSLLTLMLQNAMMNHSAIKGKLVTKAPRL